MLFVRPKIAELGLHLFQRPVHPELLESCACRSFERPGYTLQVAITTAGHSLVFRSGSLTIQEICASLNQELPSHRLVSRSLDARCCEEITVGSKVTWRSEFRVEFLDARVFLAIQQQLDAQVECEGLLHRFRPPSNAPFGGVSYISFQAFARHAVVQAFHTFPETLTVARIESRFGMVDDPAAT